MALEQLHRKTLRILDLELVTELSPTIKVLLLLLPVLPPVVVRWCPCSCCRFRSLSDKGGTPALEAILRRQGDLGSLLRQWEAACAPLPVHKDSPRHVVVNTLSSPCCSPCCQ